MSKAPEDRSLHFGQKPRGGRHLYAVARFDGIADISDPVDAFVLTRGYWDELEAERHAEQLNASVEGTETRYFVLPVRVHDEG